MPSTCAGDSVFLAALRCAPLPLRSAFATGAASQEAQTMTHPAALRCVSMQSLMEMGLLAKKPVADISAAAPTAEKVGENGSTAEARKEE